LLEDISSSGACLQLESPVPAGVELRWRCPGGEFRGLVCYCVYREIGYFVGVSFDSASQWSQNRYQPQHLLDPSRLAGPPRTELPRATVREISSPRH
jgi:hypothetical protein